MSRCKLHGQCKNGTCLCVTGWNGRHCTIQVQCSPSPSPSPSPPFPSVYNVHMTLSILPITIGDHCIFSTQCVHIICSHVFTQCVYSMCSPNMFSLCVHSMCSLNMFTQCVHQSHPQGCPAQCSSNGECRSNFHGERLFGSEKLCLWQFLPKIKSGQK